MKLRETRSRLRDFESWMRSEDPQFFRLMQTLAVGFFVVLLGVGMVFASQPLQLQILENVGVIVTFLGMALCAASFAVGFATALWALARKALRLP